MLIQGHRVLRLLGHAHKVSVLLRQSTGKRSGKGPSKNSRQERAAKSVSWGTVPGRSRKPGRVRSGEAAPRRDMRKARRFSGVMIRRGQGCKSERTATGKIS